MHTLAVATLWKLRSTSVCTNWRNPKHQAALFIPYKGDPCKEDCDMKENG